MSFLVFRVAYFSSMACLEMTEYCKVGRGMPHFEQLTHVTGSFAKCALTGMIRVFMTWDGLHPRQWVRGSRLSLGSSNMTVRLAPPDTSNAAPGPRWGYCELRRKHSTLQSPICRQLPAVGPSRNASFGRIRSAIRWARCPGIKYFAQRWFVRMTTLFVLLMI